MKMRNDQFKKIMTALNIIILALGIIAGSLLAGCTTPVRQAPEFGRPGMVRK